MKEAEVWLSRAYGTVIQKYLDAAICFRFQPQAGSRRKTIRVGATLMTCATGAAILNEMGVRGEGESAYRYINVHNPRCPLVFNQCWSSRLGLEDHPLHGVNWAGAKLMCRYLGGRLPRAYEWECFASNNDPDKKYPWGDAAPTHLHANFGEHYGGSTQVQSFPPSELGLYDLAGNLGEWCEDAYRPGAGGEVQRISGERVVKGGAWSKDAQYLEIASTRGKWERLGTTTIGFRPVWDK